jgi:hypothetical protein
MLVGTQFRILVQAFWQAMRECFLRTKIRPLMLPGFLGA